MTFKLQTLALATGLALLALLSLKLAAAPGEGKAAPDYFRAAPHLAVPTKAPIYAATKAGDRTVAVGDYGFVIYTDDGERFVQGDVPTRAPLTSVFFLDAQRGWAAGHDGTVIATVDGGKTWKVLREMRGQDQVLMGIWFANAERGLAVGQFGLALETRDGGKTWSERQLVDGEAGERHLLSIVAGRDGLLLVAAEAGTVLRSSDAGLSWQAIQTDNKGSFWTGAELADGSLLLGGMRGHLYRSTDRGEHWKHLVSSTQQSLTGIAQRADGVVRVVGLAGTTLLSKDGGQHFETIVRPDRLAVTAIVPQAKGELLFSAVGMVVRE
ncbi:YCF48-related protein [Dechloromonas sp. CZR5]|uniref:WD40/YVTN/BNR-like repeat-containing protein n=1 Tax=Dechloromonas sp. CZR5 TaxID=2608630 RepID=UPI00123E1F1E|nr:YCF48-related protein [Dechloromonas sp. CZR5]